MKSTKKYCLGIVGICGLPAAYGGFETLAEALVRFLASPEYRVLLFGQRGYQRISGESWDQYVVPLSANGASSIPFDIISLLFASSKCESVLLLGVSGAISLPFLRLCFPSVRYIVHIDGLEWSRPKWGPIARWYLKQSERISIHFSDAFIVDNLGIADYVSRCYGNRYLKRASLLSYGTSISDEESTAHVGPLAVVDSCSGEIIDCNCTSYLLVLGRAEPENNFEMIIEAYSGSSLVASGVRLLIISNALSTSHGALLLRRYSTVNGLCFARPEYDFRKVRAIRRRAMAYIHGHSAGGTNPSLVEAIAAAKPIFAFDVPYNRYTTAGIASYFFDSSTLQALLGSFLVEGLDLVPELQDLAISSYDWKDVTRDYYSLFDAVAEHRSSGRVVLAGRVALRMKRKVTRILLRLASFSRRSRSKSSRKYEYKLPNSL